MRCGNSLTSLMNCVFEIAQVGEDAGTLDTAHRERVAEFKERSAAFRNRIGTVLIYPAVVVTMAIGVSVLLMTVVVPNLLDSLQGAGRPLPLPTRVVKFASDFLIHRWWLLVLALLAQSWCGVRLFLRRRADGGYGIGNNCAFRSWAI